MLSSFNVARNRRLLKPPMLPDIIFFDRKGEDSPQCSTGVGRCGGGPTVVTRRSKNPAEKGVSPDESESTSTEDSSEVVSLAVAVSVSDSGGAGRQPVISSVQAPGTPRKESRSIGKETAWRRLIFILRRYKILKKQRDLLTFYIFNS